jgi:hypothetical protein
MSYRRKGKHEKRMRRRSSGKPGTDEEDWLLFNSNKKTKIS